MSLVGLGTKNHCTGEGQQQSAVNESKERIRQYIKLNMTTQKYLNKLYTENVKLL
jgi:hypothetical protein